jgi:hypothetical protein
VQNSKKKIQPTQKNKNKNKQNKANENKQKKKERNPRYLGSGVMREKRNKTELMKKPPTEG